MWDTLLDWLLTPIDLSHTHAIDFATAWHGRLMVGAWGLLFPVSIIKRFMKITPKQRWPLELDSRFWFRASCNCTVRRRCGDGCCGLVDLVARQRGQHELAPPPSWMVGGNALCCTGVGGLLRDSRGGPDELAADGSLHGDH